MADDTTEIDTPKVAEIAGEVTRAVGDFNSKFADASRRINALRGCWGNDKFGTSFAKNYVPNADNVLGQVTAAGKDVEQGAQQLQQAPNAFQDVDGANAGS
jgi:hypothetical protein